MKQWMTMLAAGVGLLMVTVVGAQSLLERVLGQGDDAPIEAASGDQVAAIREALAQGTRVAVEQLGQKGGFLDSEFRIPVPRQVEAVAEAARRLGQEEQVEAFETSLNRAAEAAVPAAADVFGAAIRDMTIEDAVGILRGGEHAATDYFRRTSGDALFDALNPIVRDTTDQVGVTAAYKELTKRGGGMLGGLVDTQALDLDRYVTDQSVEALFTVIGREEARIRENPAARGTELLRAVFGDG